MARISRFAPHGPLDISIEIDEGLGIGRIIGAIKKGIAIQLLQDAIDDIGDQIEDESVRQAPHDKDPDAYTWRERPGPMLKEHPIDRDIVERSHSPTHTVARQEITVTDNPYYAIFVHQGTKPGYFAKTPGGFMKYRSFGKQHKRRFVGGQAANPYLTRAFEIVDRTYVPAKVDELRIKIRALLGGRSIGISLPSGVSIAPVGRFGTRFRGKGGRFIKI